MTGGFQATCVVPYHVFKVVHVWFPAMCSRLEGFLVIAHCLAPLLFTNQGWQ